MWHLISEVIKCKSIRFQIPLQRRRPYLKIIQQKWLIQMHNLCSPGTSLNSKMAWHLLTRVGCRTAVDCITLHRILGPFSYPRWFGSSLQQSISWEFSPLRKLVLLTFLRKSKCKTGILRLVFSLGSAFAWCIENTINTNKLM